LPLTFRVAKAEFWTERPVVLSEPHPDLPKIRSGAGDEFVTPAAVCDSGRSSAVTVKV
jgi:hypothetical protein